MLAATAFTDSAILQRIWFNPTNWTSEATWSKTPTATRQDIIERVQRLTENLPAGERKPKLKAINRQDVFAQRDDPIDLFLATMIWGFGTTGYGAHRTSAIITTATTTRVRDAVRAIQEAGSHGSGVDAMAAWSDPKQAKLTGLGPAFASKVAYFAAYDHAAGRGPLIADINTAWSLRLLTGIWDSRSSSARYGEYLERARSFADTLNQRTTGRTEVNSVVQSDDIERALFNLGPTVRDLSKKATK